MFKGLFTTMVYGFLFQLSYNYIFPLSKILSNFLFNDGINFLDNIAYFTLTGLVFFLYIVVVSYFVNFLEAFVQKL